MRRWMPENISTYGANIDWLFGVIEWITGIIFVGVILALIAFLIKYRYQEGRRATYTHGNTALEITWTIVPAIILIVLFMLSQSTWWSIKGSIPAGDLQVQVMAKQFNWVFTYPGPDGNFGTDDDLTLENELHIPVNKVVRVTLRAEDVIHSFFLPNLRLKQDAVPGREIPAWFEATQTGRYEIPCAELCGFGHSGMLGYLTVHSPEEYENWRKERWPS
ncbi:MAG TPA: cytochrome c oxidase subunit II [Alphaproteobacteria bacterium]|nr:cytochrome c oxidase subunit II [Alphaproteobacteria bacterium]